VRTHVVPSTICFIDIRAIYCNSCLALKVRFSYNRYEMYAGTRTEYHLQLAALLHFATQPPPLGRVILDAS
jgi:hypothetical protein